MLARVNGFKGATIFTEIGFIKQGSKRNDVSVTRYFFPLQNHVLQGLAFRHEYALNDPNGCPMANLKKSIANRHGFMGRIIAHVYLVSLMPGTI